MRYALLLVSFAALAAFAILQVGPAEASFHCMRIDALMAGFNGNSNVQYLELRQRVGGQNLVGGHKVRFYDASNTLKATFTFPNTATNNLASDSILVATSEFNANANGGAADFTFSLANTVASNGGDALHPVQSPGGKMVWAGEVGDFNCAGGAPPSDSVAYGSFSGPVDFGTAALALPNPSDNRALVVSNLGAPTNNSTEYSLQAVATSTFSVPVGNLASDPNTPRNNMRAVLQLQASVGGIVQQPGIASKAAQAPSGSGGGGWFYAEVAAALGVSAGVLGTAIWYARRRPARRRA
jgi:hypothetical protein